MLFCFVMFFSFMAVVPSCHRYKDILLLVNNSLLINASIFQKKKKEKEVVYIHLWFEHCLWQNNFDRFCAGAELFPSVGKYRIVIKWFDSHFRKSNLNNHGVYETLDIFNTISVKCNVTSNPDLTLAVGVLGKSSSFICVWVGHLWKHQGRLVG